MQPSLRTPTRPSLTFALTEKTRGHAEVNALINDIESASAAGDCAQVERLYAEALAAIDELEARGGDGHSAPGWLAPVLRGNAAGAAGRLEEALAHQLRSLDRALDARQAARSRNNASDHLRRLGRTAEAVAQSVLATRAWRENTGFWINLGLALHADGQAERAELLFAELARGLDPDDERDVLAAHLRFEAELRAIDLPAVRGMLARIEASHAGRGARR